MDIPHSEPNLQWCSRTICLPACPPWNSSQQTEAHLGFPHLWDLSLVNLLPFLSLISTSHCPHSSWGNQRDKISHLKMGPGLQWGTATTLSPHPASMVTANEFSVLEALSFISLGLCPYRPVACIPRGEVEQAKCQPPEAVP